ncbi:MAG: hypothetical protein V4613_11870 [Bacteroidota bacterium]
MKTAISTLSIAVISAFVFMGGCVQKITTINMNYPTEANVQTQILPTTGNQSFGSVVVTSDLKKELEKNNTSLDLLDELKLKSAVISIDSTKNFNDVESIEFWLSADGLPTIKVASKNPVADDVMSISLDVSSSEDLSAYIKSTTFNYEIKGTNSAPLPVMDLKIKAVWGIKASAK